MPEDRTAPCRLYWTADGRLVKEGDPDAATLAYAEGDEISVEDQKAMVQARRAEPEPVYSDVPGSGKDDAPGRPPKPTQLPAEEKRSGVVLRKADEPEEPKGGALGQQKDRSR